jgi:hypothetical protein
MVRRNPHLQRNVTEKNFRSLIFAAHRSALSNRVLNAQNHWSTESHHHAKITTKIEFFSTLLGHLVKAKRDRMIDCGDR